MKKKVSEVVKTFCERHDLTLDQFTGKDKVSGDLYLRSVTSIPEGFNPTVSGDLDLSSVTSIPEGFNPTVGGYLYLSSVTSIPEGFNPTVSGDLYLSSVTSIPEGFNPTVGGYLYLRSVTSIPEGFNPTVGGYLYLRSDLKAKVKVNKPNKIETPRGKLLSWQNGKYVKADGIFTEVISKRGNVYKVKKVHSQKEFYLITNGEFHAHGESLEKAKEDFRFKLIADKLKKDPIKEDTVITVQYYRIVTGACQFGVDSWMNSTFNEKEKASILKNGIKAKDLLPILKKKSAYGLDRFQSLITF